MIPFRYFTGLLFIVALPIACNSPYTYKKKGYFNIDFPEKKYQSFDQPGYPYTFEYPVYGKVIKDSMFFGTKQKITGSILISPVFMAAFMSATSLLTGIILTRWLMTGINWRISSI
ncbi:MAG: hypothetical protein WDO16_11385 [Bacteroidota bacterium]